MWACQYTTPIVLRIIIGIVEPPEASTRSLSLHNSCKVAVLKTPLLCWDDELSYQLATATSHRWYALVFAILCLCLLVTAHTSCVLTRRVSRASIDALIAL